MVAEHEQSGEGVKGREGLRMYKWYERKRRDFEQSRDGKSTEIFVLGVEYFLCRREIGNAVRVLSDMLINIEWQMKRGAMRGKNGAVGTQMSVGEGRRW
jgi:hypothetical protein